MEFLARMNEVVDYIEDHITEDIDFNDIAKIVCCGVYQFGRIFAYVVGISLSEYVRRRRLSLAALELQEGDSRIIDVAIKYGYNSPDAFTRVFREMHGMTPREACTPGVSLKLYPRLTFQISIKGDAEMDYKIVDMGIIKCVGIVKNFGKWTSNEGASNWQDRMGDVWQFWDEFLDGEMNVIVRDKYKLYRPPFYQIGITRTLDNGETVIMIGAEAEEGMDYPELTAFDVPASKWAVFSAKGTLNQDEHPLDALDTKIMAEWLPSSGYEKSMNYEIQVYGPGDTQTDDYISEKWIPVRKK